jgi:uncharacterized membrane protein
MKDGAQTGPATADEIKALIASGAIKGDTLVWREGLPSWVAISTQADFSGVVPPAGPPPPPAPVGEAADIEQNKVFAVLSYLPPFLFLVPLLAARQSKFAMYHCNQGIVLTLAAFVASIANMILDHILIFIPFLGWLLMLILNLGIFIGIVVLVIMGIINAAGGVCKPLPLIGNRFTLVK